MKTTKMKTIKLGKETLRALKDPALHDVRGGIARGPISLPVCTSPDGGCR